MPNWTYGGDPSANDRDAVRFLVGDTDDTDKLLTDGEIAFAIAEASTIYGAAAVAARGIAALFSRLAESATQGRMSDEYGDRAARYRSLALELESGSGGAGLSAAGISAPGLRVSDKAAAAADGDRVTHAFSYGMMQNRST